MNFESLMRGLLIAAVSIRDRHEDPRRFETLIKIRREVDPLLADLVRRIDPNGYGNHWNWDQRLDMLEAVFEKSREILSQKPFLRHPQRAQEPTE